MEQRDANIARSVLKDANLADVDKDQRDDVFFPITSMIFSHI